MAMPQFIELLCNQVDCAKDFRGLIPIITGIGFEIEEIQSMIKRKIRGFDDSTARTIAFNAMPIDALLPVDTVQHILSFNHFTDMKFVSKSFKKSFDRNQEIIKRSRPGIIAENAHYFAPVVPFDDSLHKTFVIRPEGEQLIQRVKDLGTDVIVHDDLTNCLNDPLWSSGDRILVQDGHYEVDYALQIVDRNHQIIGIGENVEVYFKGLDSGADEYALMEIKGDSKVFLDNIKFKCKDELHYHMAMIGVFGSSRLWIRGCSFETTNPMSAVVVGDDANTCFKSCQFGHFGGEFAIQNECKRNTASMNILGCTFATGTCVETNEPVRCIGNVFTWNVGFVVCALEKKEQRKQVLDQSVFEGNLFERMVLDDYELK